MRPSGSGSTPANMSHTIDSLNVPRTFVTRSSADLITYATIRRRLQSFSIPFLDLDLELFMRSYIAPLNCFASSRFPFEIFCVGAIFALHHRGLLLRPRTGGELRFRYVQLPRSVE